MLPNFLIVGAAKCGTTALYYLLNQHPEISFPKIKEPKFFGNYKRKLPHKGTGDKTVDIFTIKTFDDYVKLFKNISNKRVGEASPDSLFYHYNTSQHIKNKLGDIPIIIVLRNPIHRAFSAYMYLKRDSRENLSFKEALFAEDERINNDWDFIWAYKKAGLYHKQIKTFLNDFSDVKIIFNEDLRDDTQSVLNDLYKFLRVNENFKNDTTVSFNPSGIPTNFLSKFILSRRNYFSLFIRELFKKIIPRSVLEKYSKKMLIKNQILDSDYIFLKNYFHDDIKKLSVLINKDLVKNWF